MSADETTGSIFESAWTSRKPLSLALVAFGLALLWERLFYGRPLGVSFPLWIGLALIAGGLWAAYEGSRPSVSAIALSITAFAMSTIVVFRVEPLTTFLAVCIPLGLGVFWLRDLQAGNLIAWGWLDYLSGAVLVPLEGLLRPWPTLAAAQTELTRGESWSTRVLAVLRGLLLALPVIVIFLVLLSQADLVFGDWVETALKWLDLERLFDILGRGLVVILLTVYLLGLLVASLRRNRGSQLVRDGQPLIKPFLGMTEAGIVLASVVAIFSVFVLVQFRYFFGGEANISATAYTYAEYARRGFGELVIVSFLTLGLILLLGNWTKQQARSSRLWFRGFSAAAVALTGVMLASAMIRLQLYERAFGFTRLRTYTHIAIIFLALLFAAFLALLFLGQLRRFALVCLVGSIGFGGALAVTNVDKLIVERNFQHLEEIGKLDGWYLASLSDDAVPTIVRNVSQIPEEELPVVLAGLSCRQHLLELRHEEVGWPSFRWPREQAARALETIEADLADYQVDVQEGYKQVKIGPDEYFYCYDFAFMR